MHPGGLNINLNYGNQGMNGCQGQYGHGPRGPQGPQGQMMRMMQMMMEMMSRMMGGQQPGQGCGCCPNSRPNFGGGNPFQQGGININMGASIRGFLG